MNAETMPMFESLPMDHPEKKKKAETVNMLPEQLRKLMEAKGVTPADMVRELEGQIAWSTLMSWFRGLTKAQIADKRLLILANYFETSLEYLLFGVGEEPHY